MRVLAFLAVLLSGCAGLIAVPPRPVPPTNWCYVDGFDVVDASLLRSPQVTYAELSCLRDMYGVTDVFKLNPWWEAREPSVPGVTVHYLPLDVEMSSRADVDHVLSEMLTTCRDGRKCLVHCTHGEDRTGLLVALWRVVHGVGVDQAYADMMRHGFHPYRALWAVWRARAGW